MNKLNAPMPENARSFLLFRSELFLYDLEDDQVDQVFAGGDCAAWLYVRLIRLPGIGHLVEPLMEDWGWYMRVQVAAPAVQVALQVYASTEQGNCWVIGFDAQRRWFRRQPEAEIRSAVETVADGLEQIIAADDRLEFLSWHAEFPG